MTNHNQKQIIKGVSNHPNGVILASELLSEQNLDAHRLLLHSFSDETVMQDALISDC